MPDAGPPNAGERAAAGDRVTSPGPAPEAPRGGKTPEREIDLRFAQAAGPLVSASPAGILAVDERGVIRFCNAAAEDILGRPAAELVGSDIGVPTGGAAEVDIVLPGGAVRVVEMRVAATTLDGHPLSVVALRDLTQARQREEALAAALERQNVVVGVATHELRNPLAAISGLAHVLLDQWADLNDPDKHDIVRRIADSGDRLQGLLHKLLTASRLDAGAAGAAPESVLVLEVILEVLGEHGPPGEEVRTSCPPALVALAEREDMREMLDNYLENARRYGRPPVEVRAVEHGSDVELRVCDRGPGVPADFVPRLFDRFSRAPHGDPHSSGLGLWIVRSLARAEGGDAWYEPHSGGGACFCLRLPSGRGRPRP